MDRRHDNLALVGPSGVGKSWLWPAPSARKPVATIGPSSIIAGQLCEDLALA